MRQNLIISFLLCVGSVAASQGIDLATDYQKNSNLQWDWAMESLQKFPFEVDDKVLDVGCGDGKITALIAQQVPEGLVVGLDVSEKMISHASTNYPASNLLFLKGDAKSIPFQHQFDKLVCFCTLHWVIDQEKALQSIKDSLKPGGSLLIVIPGKAPTHVGSVSEVIIQSEKWSSYFPKSEQVRIYFTAEEYTALLEKVQLQIQSIQTFTTFTKFKDKAAVIGYLKPLINFIDHLPQGLQQDFINDMATTMIDASNFTFPDGSIGLKSSRLEVIATHPKF